MRVLLIGYGGREHALGWKLAQSPDLEKLYVTPGNPGLDAIANPIILDVANHKEVVAFAKAEAIDLVVVGPEAPLVDGLGDSLHGAGIAVFGPDQFGAQLEGSKAFTKSICDAYDIPTARYGRFTDPSTAKAYVRDLGYPCVIKADGLAAGKGVIIAETETDAEKAVDDMFSGRFGEAGETVIIEEFLEGVEVSAFFLCDGETVLPFGTAQDHKRAYDGDQGPNTGGMGAYSPAPALTNDLETRVLNTIARPTASAMVDRGHPYRGVLYAGLMLTPDGPKLIEFNCRFGDPECQVLMMRLKSDLLPILYACAMGKLSERIPEWKSDPAITVVMASAGYPGPYASGTVIKDINKMPSNLEDGAQLMLFHAGTKRMGDQIVTAGGRVLNATATAPSLEVARKAAYTLAEKLKWPEAFFRSDIGWRALKELD